MTNNFFYNVNNLFYDEKINFLKKGPCLFYLIPFAESFSASKTAPRHRGQPEVRSTIKKIKFQF